MSSPTVTIASITGVDIELEIASAGSRSFAFLIDWSLRMLLVFAWFMVGAIIVGALGINAARGGNPERIGQILGFVLGIPAAVIYFLYHPILETLMQGRTPGKRMAGVRVLTRQGDLPGFGAILIRNVFRLIDSLPAFYVVGLITCIFTDQRIRIGDMAAGTILVIDNSAGDTAFARLQNTIAKTGLALPSAELIQELLERWWNLDEPRRVELARNLLAKLEPHVEIDSRTRAPELRTRLRRILEGTVPA
jgi:uncharacterized RDD family membrane protein YckC